MADRPGKCDLTPRAHSPGPDRRDRADRKDRAEAVRCILPRDDRRSNQRLLRVAAPLPGSRSTTRAQARPSSLSMPASRIAGCGRPLAADLASAQRVIRHDVRGVGETLPPTGAWSHHTDLVGLLDELLVTRAHVVGASMGAGIAVEVALARPKAVASLVLVGPGGALFDGAPASFRADLGRRGRGARSRRPRCRRRDQPARLGRWPAPPVGRGRPGGPGVHRTDAARGVRAAGMGCGAGARARAGAARGRAPARARLPDPGHRRRRRRPGDPRCGRADRRRGSPRARLAVLPGVGHMLSLEQPGLFAEMLSEFLGDVASGRFDGEPIDVPASTGSDPDTVPPARRPRRRQRATRVDPAPR